MKLKEGISNSLVIDTNLVIIGLKEKLGLLKSLRNLARSICISALSITELFALPGLSNEEEKQIKQTLENIKVIPVDYRIAFQAALLARTRPGRQHRSDIIIAATALITKSGLATFNEKDFTKIPGLKIIGKQKLERYAPVL